MTRLTRLAGKVDGFMKKTIGRQKGCMPRNRHALAPRLGTMASR
jgi:hypothetical protein